GGIGERDALLPLLRIGSQNENENQYVEKSEFIPEIEAVQSEHPAGGEDQISKRQRKGALRNGRGSSRKEHRQQREYNQACPVKPMRQYERQRRHSSLQELGRIEKT